MQCGVDPAANLAKAIGVHPRRSAARRADRLPAGALPLAIFLPVGRSRKLRARRRNSRADHRALEAKSRARLGVVIVASLFEKRTAGVYHNTAAIIDADGKLLGKYRKMHIPDDPRYYEKFYFTPGRSRLPGVANARGKIGVCVCWDQWYPEAARLTALRGAQILFYPTAIGWHPAEKEKYGEGAAFRVGNHAAQSRDRERLLRRGGQSRRPRSAGRRSGIEFWGQSFVVAPNGEILAKGSVDREEIVIADVDLEQVDEQRTHWPFLRDRRIDAYAGIEQRMID